MKTLDLGQEIHEGKTGNLFGKATGEKAREHFNLDDLDNVEHPVRVLVPKEVYNISPSFFCGMFGKSYKKLGADKILSHYRFEFLPEFISRQLYFGMKLCSDTYD